MGYKNYNEDMAKYMRERYAKNAEIVRQIKLERGCIDCGYREHHAGLEFDHKENRAEQERQDGKQKGSLTVARLMGKSIKRILEEIDKCDVVCGGLSCGDAEQAACTGRGARG